MTKLNEAQRLKLEKLKLLEARQAIRQMLPHLNAHKFYTWQRDFFESTERMLLLTAANQIGKSTIQIKKVIELATNKTKWKRFWPGLQEGQIPNLFWYLYPESGTATVEFKTKWLPLMPRDKDDPTYGWKEFYDKGKISHVQFNSGVLLEFKAYAQKAANLQANTVYYVACDEELPVSLYPEIQIRTQACDGLFSMVFTATLGQEFWRQAMEPRPDEDELFPEAWKRQVSLFDCMFYEDGTPGQYDEDKIRRAIARCGTQNEILRRVFGKFVTAGGRRFEAFDTTKNCMAPVRVDPSWLRFCGIDSGSGGEEDDTGKSNDPAAIVFVAVSPDYKRGVVYKAWRGDKILTTSADIVAKYLEMRGEEELALTVYDYSDKDLHTIASSMGHGFVRADKGHDRGDGILNTLFKNKLLYLFDEGDILKLAQELSTIKKGSKKAMDHLSDALRYICVAIGWDLSDLTLEVVKPLAAVVERPLTHEEFMEQELRERRGEYSRDEQAVYQTVDQELDEWQDLYEV